MNSQVDVRSLLPSITAPTLLLYRQDDPDISVEEGEYIADAIRGARLRVLPGGDHLFWAGDIDLMLEEIEEFVTGERGSADPDRRLATVMFTDIVDSTKTAASLGDAEWRMKLEDHNRVVRSELERWRGVEVGTTGDGFLATFDGPVRAINCGLAIRSSVESLGLQIRGGVHTGMVEVVGDDVAGLAVHIGARIGATAGQAKFSSQAPSRNSLLGQDSSSTIAGSTPSKGSRWMAAVRGHFLAKPAGSLSNDPSERVPQVVRCWLLAI